MTRIVTIASIVWLKVLRRKDVYVLAILLGALLLLMASVPVWSVGGTARYVADVGLLTAWIFSWILAVAVPSREFADEESSGTIFSLLAKPVSRFEIVVGKWLGSWSVVCATTLAFYALAIAVSTCKGGTVESAPVIQSYLMHCAALGVISAGTLVACARLTRDAGMAISYIMTATAFAVIPRVPEMMAYASEIPAGLLLFLYNALPHFEVFDLRRRVVHGYGPCACQTFATVIAYGLIWTAGLVLLAWLAYREKRFVRGQILE